MRFVSMFRRSALVMGGPLLLLAACSTPTDSVAPLQSEALSFQAPEAIATELANPRGITVTPDGAILVAEAGSGGDGPHFMGGEGSELHFGTTGAVTRIDTNGQRRVLEGLPSLAAEDGTRAMGPNDISLLGNGTTYITTGLGADPAILADLGLDGAGLGMTWRVSQARGTLTAIADIAGYEAARNPDGGAIDSNAYGITAAPSGQLVTDAGGNSLLWVAANGKVTTLAVFPDTLVLAPPMLGLPEGTNIPMQSVPTSVAVGPDGAYYVGLLTGFPFPVGGASVMRVVPGEAPTVYATGFTNIVDVAFGPDGNLYVLEIATNGLLSGDLTGALKRVVDGVIEEVPGTEGALTMPGGFTFDKSGDLYVTNLSVTPAGTVLHFAN